VQRGRKMAENKGDGDSENPENVILVPCVEDTATDVEKEMETPVITEQAQVYIEAQSPEKSGAAPNGGGESTTQPAPTSTTTTPPVPTTPTAHPPVLMAPAVPSQTPSTPTASTPSAVSVADSSPSTAPAPTPPINLLDTCAVCRQSLQSRDCEPKLLPCLHSFCLRCIPPPDRQVSLQLGPHGQETQIVNVMRCPVCRQDFKQTDVVDNYFVKDTSEVSGGSDENSAQVCTSCEDNAHAVGFCVVCGEWLCKTCIEAHQRVKFTKDHMIRKKEDVSSDSVGTSGQRPVFCPVHKQEALKLFCETCDRLTCRDCQLLEHKEHRYQFLEEAFQNQKGIIETFMAKLQEKKNYVNFAASQVQSRIKEVNETHKKVEHEIKVAVFTLINEINKKGKSLLQQLESVTKERNMKLMHQQKDITSLAQQVMHVLNFANWAICSGSSTALLYSKRLITFQLRYILKARCDPVPSANGAVRFFCDPTFWAKNVVNLGNLVIENKPPPVHAPNVVVGPGPGPGVPNHTGKHPGQINLAQLRLQHIQNAAFAHKQQQMQQLRMAQHVPQHPRPGAPQMVQQQPPRLISMQTMQRASMNGAFQAHQMRMAQSQSRMPGVPRHNGQQYPMMQPQLQRQHSNPGHTGPFPVASLHNSVANPTSPTTASMASANRGPTSPSVSTIELIPSVTNPENLPCLPDIPPIQLEDAGSSTLDNLLSRYISASHHIPLAPTGNMNPSPGPSALSPGSTGITNSHTPVRPSSTSSTGSRAASGIEQMKIKQEPGVEEECGFTGTMVKQERGDDGRRSACMLSSPESSLTPPLTAPAPLDHDLDVLRSLEEHVKMERKESSGSCKQQALTTTTPVANGKGSPRGFLHRLPRVTGPNNDSKDDDPNEDWCAVCQNGGNLLCCDKCPKVFHLTCHVPTLLSFPSGEWICTFCRCLNNMEFHEPVPASIPNYYKIIKKPMDLGTVKKKLQKKHSQHYQTPQEFVSDVRLIFRNCAKFNEMSRIIQVYDEKTQINLQAESEVAQAGKTVELFFEEKLKETYTDQSFPAVTDLEPEEDEEITEDSDDDFVQPRRKRLKIDEKPVHIK
uniref:RING-type E3 ubiquitin transferase n=1 Tax=Erpetoichthys calabaricus TaxID=27687 RepID=A0A8C4SUG3_ERPCA